MGIFRQFPYSNFHEMNMDELIKMVRELADDWVEYQSKWQNLYNDIDSAFTAFKNDFDDFIAECNTEFQNFIRGLDLDAIIRDVLDAMIADGSIATIINPVIINETRNWLESNITQPTSPVIDTSLSVRGAGADSAVTGGRLNCLGTFYTLDTGRYYPINALVIDISNPTTDSGWSSKVIECVEGDMFLVTLQGVASPSAYAFIDSSGNVLDRDMLQTNLQNLQIVAPLNTRYLVVNNANSLLNTPVVMKLPDNIYHTPILRFKLLTGRYYNLPSSGVIDINNPTYANGWSSRAVPCREGDVFYVTGRSVGNPALIYFIDDSGTALIQDTGRQVVVNCYKVTAPIGAKYFIMNNVDTWYPRAIFWQIKAGKDIIVDKSGNGDYTSLTDAITTTMGDIIVKAGDYDIVAEYKAKFGNDIFTHISDSYPGIGMYRYGLFINNRKITFEPGTKVLCDLNGVLNVDGTHRFSPFNLASNAHIKGLYCDANAVFYLIHDDYGAVNEPYINIIEDCVLTGNIVNTNIIGGGTRIYSTNIVRNCYMNNRVPGSETMRYHNYNNPKSQPKVIVEGCRANGSIGARYYGDQNNPKMVFVAHNNSTGSGVILRPEDNAQNVNVNLFTWGNVIE